MASQSTMEAYLAKLEQIRSGQISQDVIDTAEQLKSRPIIGRSNDDPESERLSKAEESYINKLFTTTLVETREEEIEMLRSDPDNPLHSAKTFQELNLDERILQGIFQMRFHKPSGIQGKALPYLLDSKPVNMIAQSQSGTGKTATFLLTMLAKVDVSKPCCQCICMSPTRELASQIASVGQQMASQIEGLHFGLAIREGNCHTDEQGFVTSQIVIGTPGTLFNYFKPHFSVRIDPSQVRIFVLDEADVLLEEENFYNLSLRMRKKLMSDCQVLLFSATFDEDMDEFSREMVPDPVTIRVKRSKLTLDNIKQFYRPLANLDEKYTFLTEIYRNFSVGQAIIFCGTRNEAHWLQAQLEQDGYRVGILTAALPVEEREAVITRFREAHIRVLISTNVCSRGLDIPQVNLIINWNMPRDRMQNADCETYLHRIGRSGRFGKKGLAINFVTPDDENVLFAIEQHFNITIPKLSSDDLAAMSKAEPRRPRC